MSYSHVSGSVALFLVACLAAGNAVIQADETTPKQLTSDPQLAADLKLLIGGQIVESAEYWLAHANAGQRCDGQQVETMLTKMARQLAFSLTRDAALRVLAEEKIVRSVPYWDEHAKAGGSCHGEHVRTVIRNFATRLRADAAKTGDEPRAIFVPTPYDVVDKMLEAAQVKKEDVVYDLGCGDGRIVVTAAVRYGCRAVGFDIEPQKVQESRDAARRHQVEKLVRVEQKDLFTVDLREATVVTLYLLPEMNLQLLPQLEKMKSGSRVVAHDFGIEVVKHDQLLTIKSQENGVPRDIYLYKLPWTRK